MSKEAPSDKKQPEVETLGPVTSEEDLSPDVRAMFAELNTEAQEEQGEKPVVSQESAPAESPEETEEEPEPEVQAENPFTNAFEKLRVREQAIAEQRQELKAAMEEIQRYKDLGAGWTTDRVGTLERDIANRIGSDDPERIKAEIRALYEDMTMIVLDVPPDANKKALSEAARVRYEFEAYKRKQTEADEQRQREYEQQEYERKAEQAVQNIDGYISDVAHEYPNLTAWCHLPGEATPGAVVWEVMSAMLAEDPDHQPTIREAAEKAETYFKTKVEALHPLLSPNAGEQPPEPSKPTPTPSKPRATRTLTNSQVSTVPQPSPELEFLEDNQEAQEQTIRRLGQMIRQSSSD